MSSTARVGAIVGGVAVLGVLVALGVSFASMRKASNAQMCAANLRILYMAVRAGDLLDSPRWDAVPTGRAFIASADRWPTVQRREFDPCCPVKGTRDDIDYRGPAVPPRQLKADDAFLADRPGNHGPDRGGNVAFKDGRIVEARDGDDAWARAARTTSD